MKEIDTTDLEHITGGRGLLARGAVGAFRLGRAGLRGAARLAFPGLRQGGGGGGCPGGNCGGGE